jgi:hypothetical protein
MSGRQAELTMAKCGPRAAHEQQSITVAKDAVDGSGKAERLSGHRQTLGDPWSHRRPSVMS